MNNLDKEIELWLDTCSVIQKDNFNNVETFMDACNYSDGLLKLQTEAQLELLTEREVKVALNQFKIRILQLINNK